MQRHTLITRWADRIIESGWLLALVFTPYFFNLLTARHFEPDKAMALRTIVLVMLAAWAAKTIDRATTLKERPRWRALWLAPLAIPALSFAAVFVLATLTSVQPATSWWGSYQRGQGTYTNLSYIALFALIVGNLRTRSQLHRLLTAVILAGVAVSIYGIMQHFQLDPLPWKGDVISRISSTMGNSIFVAAYLIMVVPWVLSRLATSVAQFRSAPAGEAAIDWTWLGFFGLLFFGQQALLIGMLKFMAAVRPMNGDFRYWWVFPAALALITGTFALVNAAHTTQPNKRLPGVLLAGFGSWALLFAVMFGASSGSQTVATDNANAVDWWLWLLLGVASVAGFLVASLFLPRRSAIESRTFARGQIVGNSIALALILLAIFFSQSRGPWIGGMAGVGVFVVLLLIRLIWTGQAEGWASLPRLRSALWATLGLGVVLGGLLITFNVSDAPLFERLRNVQYVGRLGRLLETDDGTGRVRTLIWFGDDVGGGAVGLLRSNWLRTLTFGHGPETMFTAYNPFYPPELARYEARGASPDRSHQAWLDELVTKGSLGLASYFFIFGSAAWLALRQLRRSAQFGFQVVSIAALAAIVAHFVEVLVGIPVVSTLTMLWATFGVLVVAGLLEGVFALNDQPATDQVAQPVAEPVPSARGSRSGGRNAGGRGGRAGAQGRAVASTAQARGGFAWTLPVLLIGALALGWFWNLRVNYADMFLNQAQSFTVQNADGELFAYSKLLRAVEIEPSEDYYYLQLGNSLLKQIYPYKLLRQQTFDASTAPRSDQSVQDLFVIRPANERLQDQSGRALDGEIDRAYRLFQGNSTEQMLRYAELVLQRAFELNPGNKDHPANLGRLYSLWARRVNGGPSYLQQAADSFETARRIAPNDVSILNELATTLAYQGKIDEAEARFQESIRIDPRYAETYARLGELYRTNDRVAEAATQYVAAIERNRSILEAETRQLQPILESLASTPDALARVRAAFEDQKAQYDEQRARATAEGRAPVADARFLGQLGRVRAAADDLGGMRAAFDELIALDPNNVAYRQQYTTVLSDTAQFDAALQQAEQALTLARQQQLSRQATDLENLINMMRAKAGG